MTCIACAESLFVSIRLYNFTPYKSEFTWCGFRGNNVIPSHLIGIMFAALLNTIVWYLHTIIKSTMYKKRRSESRQMIYMCIKPKSLLVSDTSVW